MNSTIWRVRVVVMPKDGVSDPQGEAVKGGLTMLGHTSVARVRVGRHIEIDLEAESEIAARGAVTRMADQLLANPVIEQYEIGSISAVATEAVG